jgi:hypothetical protein
MKRSDKNLRDIELQCARRCRNAHHANPVTLGRYERKLQRSQEKDVDDDDAAGPLPVITASGKVARADRPKAPAATAATAAAAPPRAAPPQQDLTPDQIYLKQLARAQDDFENKRGIIAESCGLIVEDPQQHFNRLPQVVALINVSRNKQKTSNFEPQTFSPNSAQDSDLKIAKLAIASLALLFKVAAAAAAASAAAAVAAAAAAAVAVLAFVILSFNAVQGHRAWLQNQGNYKAGARFGVRSSGVVGLT